MDNPTNSAIFGGGCFWCLEAIFQRLKGVEQVTSGYAGGGSENQPTYHNHGNHAEVVKIDYNPNQITYNQLLEVFWSIHDPTTLNRQGNDVGPSYRSIILYQDEEEKTSIDNSIEQVAKELWEDPLTTEIKPLDKFTPAEEYHQDYYQQNQSNPYCQLVINPKLAKFKKRFTHLLKSAE